MQELKHVEHVGVTSFGVVGKVPVEKADDFLFANRDLFEESGFSSMLRALKIPESFFSGSTSTLKPALVVSQMQSIREKCPQFYVFQHAETHKILYVGASGSVNAGHDITEVLGFKREKGWMRTRVDYSSGLAAFVQTDLEKPRQWLPGLFVLAPILFQTVMKVRAGLFKVVCTNGVVRSKMGNVSKLQLDVRKGFSPKGFEEVLLAARSGLGDNAEAMVARWNRLQIKPDAAHLLAMHLKISRSIRTQMVKHIDLLRKGEKFKEPAPSKIENIADMVDIATFFAQEATSLSGQKRAEEVIFETFEDPQVIWEKANAGSLAPA